jgi:DNA-directed RNA polymerase III subunit Rpc31
MSRGGKSAGRGRGGRRTGPDVSWDDEPVVPQSTKPEPLFPVSHTAVPLAFFDCKCSRRSQEVDLPIPRPLTEDEIDRVDHYLDFRDEVRNGPYYTILDPSSFTDDKGKTNPRAGFDPFSNVERYSSKFYKPKRTIPDLSGCEYGTSAGAEHLSLHNLIFDRTQILPSRTLVNTRPREEESSMANTSAQTSTPTPSSQTLSQTQTPCCRGV